MDIRYSLADLREIFDVRITASDIAEPLESFAMDQDARNARATMEGKEFDVAGVRKNGRVSGYVERGELVDRSVGDHAKSFDVSVLVTESTGLFKLLSRLRDVPQLFVLDSHQVGAIVTRADLQKAPVRLSVSLRYGDADRDALPQDDTPPIRERLMEEQGTRLH